MWIEYFKDQYYLIELTDFCNYNCIMCCHDRPEGPHSSRQGFMDKALFKKIMSELPKTKTASGLKLFWLGEPFLNPTFQEMLEIACQEIEKRELNFYIDLHTNAYFLSEEITEILLKWGRYIPRITLSLDAATGDTYKKIRRGGDLNIVQNNIEHFLKRREELGVDHPTLIFQFIVMDNNMDEAGDFVKHWEETVNNIKNKKFNLLKTITSVAGHKLGKKIQNKLDYSPPLDVVWMKRVDVSPDKIEHAEKIYVDTMERFNLKSEVRENLEIIVSPYNLWNPQEEDKVREEKVKDIPKRRPCSGLWKTPAIKWDGELTVCCFDPSMELSIGNLKNSSFDQLWHGETIEKMRKAHIKGEFDKVLTHDGYKKCSNCCGLDTPFLSDTELELYKKETGFED